ncbi:retrovirus-related pol polyprotein from transposon TNT 1-94 [Tanacetum coccineum]
MGLPEDVYVAFDSCETAQVIWLRVQQMMKGFDIGIKEKKANLFNEWEMFTSIDGESIESYYHRFSKLMNDFKRNKHFPEKIASNLKFLNNLQPEWSRYVEIAQSCMNLGQDRQMQMVTVQNVGNLVVQNAVQNLSVQNVGNQNGLIVVLGIANQNANQNGNGNVVAERTEGNGNGSNRNQVRCYNCRGMGHIARNCTVRLRRRDAAYLQTQLLIAQKEEAGIQLQAEEFDLMAAARDLDEIEEVNANYILMANLQQASTSGTQTDKASIYDSDGSDENDSNVIYAVSSMEQSGGTIEQNPATFDKTRAYFESLYNNLAIKVEKVNSVNHKMKETNADLTIELARYKNQEKCFEINKEKYDKLERCYQKFVYQEQCLSKNINALHLSSAKTITTLNEEIANLNNQLSKEKSMGSFLQEEKKKLKSQSIQTMRMLSPKPDSFYHTEQKEALGDTATCSRESLKNEIIEQRNKTSKYAKINQLSEVFVSQKAKSREELYFSNTSKTANISKSISIPNEEFSDDTSPSVARKFLNENDKSEVVCAMCKQCLITSNHDVSVLNYVNGMNSHDNHSANVSKTENKKKHKPKGKKPKNVGSKERLASPKPIKPRSYLRSKDEAQEEIKTFLEKITVLLLPQQNEVVKRKNRTLVEATRTMLIFSCALLFLWAEAIATGKLGAKGDIGFFISYSDTSCAYRVYNRRTKKIIEMMNVTFDELSTMDFEQRSLKLRLQGMSSGQISSRLDLTYAPSTITSQKPTERKLDVLFEAMYDDYICGQPPAATRTSPAAQTPQVLQTPTTSTTTADTASTPTNSSPQATIIPNTSQDVDELEPEQQHVHQQDDLAQLQYEIVANNIPNAMLNRNTFLNPFAPPSTSAAESSSSQYVDPSNMHTFYQPYLYEYQWTKDHPLEQVIG